MNKKAFVHTAIPYVNGKPHIGHALELVQADTLARGYRLLGYDTYFLTGSDENAQKNVEAAEKEGFSTQSLVDKNSEAFLSLQPLLNLTFDQFIRTSSEKHKKGAEKLWELCKKDIYKKTYQGLYCVGCETFYKDGEFPDNICPHHNRKLDTVEEENYFFSLSKYQQQVEEVIKSDTVKIFPTYRKQEVLNFINKGLEDFSISRPASRVKGWGVPVPGDDNHRMYVWFDALTNYITSLDFDTNGELFQNYWMNNENRLWIGGKDIIKFHSIYWIAMLLSANLPLPTHQYVHGFITVDGQKMSKSIGNVIDPHELIAKYGVDPIRFYFLREIPSLDDGDFSFHRMEQLYNSDLANELGNLLSRITTIAAKDGIMIEKPSEETNLTQLEDRLKKYEFGTFLENVWEQIKTMNKAVNEHEPWKKTPDERKEFIVECLKVLQTIGIVLQPFMPTTAEKILQATTGNIQKIEPLFPRLK